MFVLPHDATGGSTTHKKKSNLGVRKTCLSRKRLPSSIMTLLTRVVILLQLLLLHTVIINAVPPAEARVKPWHHEAPTLRLNLPSNQTTPNILSNELTAFPPGPPEHQFIYTLPGTSSAIIFYPLGFIPHRDERLVRRLLLDALDTSLEFRADAKLPVQRGYHLRIKNMVLAVAHVLGVFELTFDSPATSIPTAQPTNPTTFPEHYEKLSEEEINEHGERLYVEITSITTTSMRGVGLPINDAEGSHDTSLEAGLATKERLKQLSAEIDAIAVFKKKRIQG
ncbi:MAG: hypothetical protein HETSPECPRED_010256 [Heterodermia speciosa]|uniref:Uncharacterized protein n=1 Tax=Heterodermia speciosa TaxID=116794 RepID=A0A8H3ERQ5_9LECA|nr:MAG: hypothetical protein HETSPECPRED_010256 [Heterodermia speciosa]